MDNKIIINSNGESYEIKPKLLDIEKLRYQAIKSAVNLLDVENIAYIIYIDDKFDPNGQKEEYKARLSELKTNGRYITTENFSSIDWTSPTPRFESQIIELWDGSDDKKKLLYEVCTHINDEESANVIPALEIENCFGARIKLMTPDEWFKDEYQLIKSLEEDQKALCLFDFEFQSGNSLLPGKNGAQLAKNLIEIKELSEKIVCGIFSHKFSETEEDDYRVQYAEDYDIDITKFYTISKFRFAFDPKINAFIEGVKNLLLHPYVEKLKRKSLEVLKTSNDKASTKIEEISPKTFNQIIQKSSLKEGVWEVSTLLRLYGILSKEENFNIISNPDNRKEFNEDINKIRRIDLIQTGYSSNTINQQLINLRNSELYLNKEVVNKLHLPLSNGDIFEIKGKEYILLVQPCNLALRAENEKCGKRDYEYDTGILIPLKLINKDELNINTEEIKLGEIINKFLVGYFSSFQIVSLNILDLVVFNENGSAVIDLNNNLLSNDVIHFPWKKRYEYIYKNFINYEIKINEFLNLGEGFELLINQKKEQLKTLKEQNLKAEIKALSKEIGTLKSNFENTYKNISNIEDLRKFKIDCTKIYNPETRIIDFQIKRKRHYKNPYSDDLLQKFMQYLSRNAFDHDFTS